MTIDVETYGWLSRQGHQLTLQFLDSRSQALITAMHVVTTFGGGFILSGIALLAGLIFAYRQRNWTPLLILVVVLGGIKAIGATIKVVTARARPPAEIAVYLEPTYAYPSGHTTATTAVCVTLAVLVSNAVTARAAQITAWVAAVAVSAAMGASRVVLGVHWLTDVLGGWLLGSAWALLCLAACRAICAHYHLAFPPRIPITRRSPSK